MKGLGYRRRQLFNVLLLQLSFKLQVVVAFCSHCEWPFSLNRHAKTVLGAVPCSDGDSAITAPTTKNQTTYNSTSSLATADAAGILSLQQQAAALRAQAASLEKDLRSSQEAKRQKELADIDRWIEECLYVTVQPIVRRKINPENNNDDNDNSASTATTTAARIELLNSVEMTAQVLRDGRYSHEQVSKMFERICDTGPVQSRSNCSPLLALLVDAAGNLDCIERDENPNKRWDGRVERDLRQRLFAMDWGINLEPRKEGNDRFL